MTATATAIATKELCARCQFYEIVSRIDKITRKETRNIKKRHQCVIGVEEEEEMKKQRYTKRLHWAKKQTHNMDFMLCAVYVVVQHSYKSDR